jgi:UDP-N-acetylmuramoyl-L-alanyl-D-glutamate--2,6-diaminopimelate ligase
MFGTTGHMIGDEFIPALTTTPSALELAQLMAWARDTGAKFAILEASSHALDQQRLAGIDFDVAVFTNISGDHLDYHGSMEQYRRAKAKLFEHLQPTAIAVLNRADPTSADLARQTPAKEKIWYGLGTQAEVRATDLNITAAGSSFILNCADNKLPVNSRLPGTHNVANCLAAAATALALGLPLKTIVDGLGQLQSVPGRLEPVPWPGPFSVLVDYAHTHDALANVLRAVQAITQRQLIVVFGCGGDRDRSKRPKMAAQASDLADRIFVTSDNPRTEDPDDIIRQILKGITRQARPRTQVITDRRAAIEAALASAAPGDVVLLAGKGHESYQIIGSQRRPFDDRAIAAEWLDSHSANIASEHIQ